MDSHPVLHNLQQPEQQLTSTSHVFGLHHRQDSDDNLMRAKTFGWQLNEDEIRSARAVAARKALRDLSLLRCGTPGIHVKD